MVDINTDSKMEQRNDTAIADKRNNIKSVIICCLFGASAKLIVEAKLQFDCRSESD